MIESFRHRGLKRFHEQDDRRGVRPDLAGKVQKILTALEAAETPEELDLPTFHFHALTGNRRGQFSVTVRANWRITFTFRQGAACDVNLEDYH